MPLGSLGGSGGCTGSGSAVLTRSVVGYRGSCTVSGGWFTRLLVSFGPQGSAAAVRPAGSMHWVHGARQRVHLHWARDCVEEVEPTTNQFRCSGGCCNCPR